MGKGYPQLCLPLTLMSRQAKYVFFDASKSHLCPEMHATRTTLNFSKRLCSGIFFFYVRIRVTVMSP